MPVRQGFLQKGVDVVVVDDDADDDDDVDDDDLSRPSPSRVGTTRGRSTGRVGTTLGSCGVGVGAGGETGANAGTGASCCFLLHIIQEVRGPLVCRKKPRVVNGYYPFPPSYDPSCASYYSPSSRCYRIALLLLLHYLQRIVIACILLPLLHIPMPPLIPRGRPNH